MIPEQTLLGDLLSAEIQGLSSAEILAKLAEFTLALFESRRQQQTCIIVSARVHK